MDETQTCPELSANPRSRKRQLDSDDDAEPRTKRARTSEPARLTRQNLARFNKMGKKGTSKAPPSASDPSNGSLGKSSGTTRALSTTASGFADQAYKNGILDPLDSNPPPNFEDVRERLARSRTTASPPEPEYKRYINKVEGASNEATLVFEVGGKLLKEYDDKGYSRVFNQAFTGYPEDVGFNKGLSAPQPDFVEGLRKREYHPFPVDERVSGAVLYKDDPHSLTLPHLAGEWKGPRKNMREARMQAAYDGAALVYARNQALSYMGKSDPSGYAEITTFTTDGTNLNLFAHHATSTEEGALEYHQYPIKSINLIDSYQGYKEGRKHLRNAQDYAREQSYALKDQLKEYYKQQRHSGLHPVAEEVPPLPVPGIEPLNDHEDEGDYEVIEHQPVYQPAPPTSSKPKHSKSHHSQSHHSHHSLAFDVALIEGPLIYTQLHPQQQWQAKSFVLTIVPRVFRHASKYIRNHGEPRGQERHRDNWPRGNTRPAVACVRRGPSMIHSPVSRLLQPESNTGQFACPPFRIPSPTACGR